MQFKKILSSLVSTARSRYTLSSLVSPSCSLVLAINRVTVGILQRLRRLSILFFLFFLFFFVFQSLQLLTQRVIENLGAR